MANQPTVPSHPCAAQHPDSEAHVSAVPPRSGLLHPLTLPVPRAWPESTPLLWPRVVCTGQRTSGVRVCDNTMETGQESRSTSKSTVILKDMHSGLTPRRGHNPSKIPSGALIQQSLGNWIEPADGRPQRRLQWTGCLPHPAKASMSRDAGGQSLGVEHSRGLSSSCIPNIRGKDDTGL